MKRKKLVVLLISFNLAIIAVLGGMVYQKHLEIERHEMERVAVYYQAFAQLAEHVAGIDLALQKCRYATSSELIVALGTEIYGRAAVAGLSLDKLPLLVEGLAGTRTFVTRVGDYARALARDADSEVGHSEEAFSNLQALAETASRLSENLGRIAEGFAQEEQSLEGFLYAMDEIEGSVGVFLAASDGRGMRAGLFAGLELVYDGPYSDHLLERQPQLLEGKEEVGQDEAKRSVSEVFDLKRDIFSFIGSRDGDIPVYRFLARVDGGDFVVEVSKVGGQVLRAQNSRAVRNAPLTKEEGLRVARDFISRNGHEKMELRHWWVEENRVTGRFMHVEDGVVCYPDWIEVSVALDNGRVAGLDAMGYVMSHRERELQAPLVSMDEAMEAIPPQLTLIKDGMAIIFTSGKHEVLCYAFLCRNEAGEKFMVYVNAQTGRQQDIRIVVEDGANSFIL